MRELEEKLFAQFPVTGREKPIFIVGAPRTGTTLVYQLLCRHFDVAYLSNLVNDHFNEYPAVGYCVQKAAAPDEIPLWASYGRAPGPYQPSECSEVFKTWFPDEHPSQTKSRDFYSDKCEQHMKSTIAAVSGISGGKRVIIKNAWNCFRYDALLQAFPQAKFLWIRRSLYRAAASDLVSRLVVKRDPYAWNSATPSRWEYLKLCSYIEQVVENQYAYNIELDAEIGSHQCVWYEDLIKGSINAHDIAQIVKLGPCLSKFPPLMFKDDPSFRLDTADRSALDLYIRKEYDRLAPYMYKEDK